jgi:preprotein translocase subunit SecE
VADNKRGRRSTDDEFEDDEFDDVDDVADDGLDDLLDSDETDDDDDAAATPASRSRAAKARAVARQSKDVKPRESDAVGVGLFGRLIRFVREIVAELQKVIWPTRKELLTYTSVVVVFVAAIMLIVTGFDLGFARLMFLVFGSQTTT